MQNAMRKPHEREAYKKFCYDTVIFGEGRQTNWYVMSAHAQCV